MGGKAAATEQLNYNPPQLTTSSVWLYHSSSNLSLYRCVRYAEIPFSLWAIFVSDTPLVIIPAAIAAYHLFLKAFFWEPIYRTAIRIDYLPNIEMVSVTKVGPFGVLYNTLWKISDFERVDTIPEVTRRKLTRIVLLENESGGRRIHNVSKQIDWRTTVI